MSPEGPQGLPVICLLSPARFPLRAGPDFSLRAGVSYPMPLNGTNEFVSLSAGGAHTCGLGAAGDAWCWGHGTLGELGYGGNLSSAVPVRVAGGSIFSQIAAGGKHTCALTSAGKAWCWGSGRFGELGTGKNSSIELEPVPVATKLSFVAITCGGEHT